MEARAQIGSRFSVGEVIVLETPQKFETVEIGRLVPYVNNARTHSAEQISQLRASFREFGFVNPILVDANLNVIAGHGRLEAAKAEGLAKVPCVFVEHLTPAQKKAYIIADNRLAENAGWNEELLKLELENLRELNFDIALTGFEDFEFKSDEIPAEDDFDVEEELAKPAVAKVGDVWQLGRHKIICGDATKPETYDKLLGGEKVQLVLSDPPYLVDVENQSGKILNDDLDEVEGLEFLTAAFGNFRDAMTKDASAYIFYATARTRIFYEAFEKFFKIGAGLVWKKDSLVLTRTDWKYIHEPLAFMWRKDGKHIWYGDEKQTTVFEFPRIKNSATEGFGHPTSKPVELLAYLMKQSSKRGDKVLDGFLGSGSTLIAAEKLGRTCFGIEIEPKYIDVTVERFKQLTGEKVSRLN
ncbi:MAG: site-specific DNA-methyltransferase [Selenomonadaceae bacterium]|nr:site-specific DNA-methyltransferase [Selenomonadaceae bacterium]